MCGIGGKLAFSATPDEGLADAMLERLTHRGPDDEGVYATGPILFAHRRLSILDLSRAGRQPMTNHDESIVIVFNGEIYNYRELRERLDTYKFSSETDTEVLLHMYEEHGTDCLSHLRGMFAFAIWDTEKNRLFLARDRLGQKPLYYRNGEDAFWFGSTVKSILADPSVDADPDLGAIREFLTYSFVPSPLTGFKEIKRLRPAEYMLVDPEGLHRERYWNLSHSQKLHLSPDKLAERTRDELREATRLRLRSDVPLGVFLSGGIDSSLTTALMSDVADMDVETYSIGFDVGEYDELDHARRVAERFGTNHHEYRVTPDSVEVIPDLIEHYEMPFGDPSAIPTYYVSKVASDEITVALTGDAGDENFAGYDRYTYDTITSWVNRIPKSFRSGSSYLLDSLPPSIRSKNQIGRIRRLLEAADRDPLERYTSYIYIGPEGVNDHFGNRVWKGSKEVDQLAYLRKAFSEVDGPTRLDKLMALDIRTYLPDDLLVKVDRASMAHSIEVRSPFLDHVLVEFAAMIPSKYKWRRGKKKWLLKRAFKSDLPDRILGRSKQGFSVPVDVWFRDELASYGRKKLERLGRRDPFRSEILLGRFDDHFEGRISIGGDLWNAVILEHWFERYFD